MLNPRECKKLIEKILSNPLIRPAKFAIESEQIIDRNISDATIHHRLRGIIIKAYDGRATIDFIPTNQAKVSHLCTDEG